MAVKIIWTELRFHEHVIRVFETSSHVSEVKAKEEFNSRRDKSIETCWRSIDLDRNKKIINSGTEEPEISIIQPAVFHVNQAEVVKQPEQSRKGQRVVRPLQPAFVNA